MPENVKTPMLRLDIPTEHSEKLRMLQLLTRKKRNQAVAVAIDIAVYHLERVPDSQRPAYINGIR